MSLFSCFNPTCCRGFNTKYGMEQHMRRFVTCAEYAAATIMYATDESDSEIDSISPEAEGDILNNDDDNNCSIGIEVADDDDDDDDDDNINEPKQQRIGELLNDFEMLEDGSFPISRENLIDMLTPEDLPPRIDFQFSLLCLLSHSSIPLYIYSEVIRMINEMIQQNENDNGSQFKTPFLTS